MELEKNHGKEVYADLLYKIARIQASPEEAQQIWITLLKHAQKLSRQLGRNVGIHVAACDYFSTVTAIVKHPILIEESLLKKKEESTFKDGLTGLFNRRYFTMELTREIERFRRFNTPFSLLMLDLDHFKQFNDRYGHMAGDQALKTVAEIITRLARIYDKAVRYGGEEFAVILPRADRKEALTVAERIRETMEKEPVLHGGLHRGPLTLSVGVSTYPLDALDMADLVKRADQALYMAKCKHNCVAAYSGSHRRYINLKHTHERSLCQTPKSHPA